MEKDPLNIKMGAPQYCPRCGGHNSSGKKLPEDCFWCGNFAKIPIVDLRQEAERMVEGLSNNQPRPVRVQALADELLHIKTEAKKHGIVFSDLEQIAAELEKEK